MPNTELAQVIDHVASYLIMLKEDGISELEISKALPFITSPTQAASPSSSSAPTKEMPTLNLENSNLSAISCQRFTHLNDPLPKEESILLLVAEQQHLAEPYLSTLVKMVHAMGYEMGPPASCTAEALGNSCAIISMGQAAFDCLSGSKKSLALARGKVIQHEGLTILPIFSPDFFQENVTIKKEIWKDLQGLLRRLGLTLPPK